MKLKTQVFRTVISALCVIALTSCGNAVPSGNAPAQTSADTEAAAVSEDTPAETPAESEEPAEAETEPAADADAKLSEEEENTPAESLTDLKIVYFTTFEDGDISSFVNRGENDTTELSVSDEFAKGGTKSLMASGRSETWNGPAFRLDGGICEADKEYYISACAMQRDGSPVMLSFQYTDEAGETHYSNLASDGGSDWASFQQIKVGFTSGMTDVYVYFEGGTSDIFVDNFNIAELPSAKIENDLVSLSELFADDFKVGTALTPAYLSANGVMALTEKHLYSSLTVGNEMKPDYVLDKNATLEYFNETGDDETPQISFAAAKPLLDYCRDNGIPMRIHTLVWHSQTPLWFFKEGYDPEGEWVSAEKMTKRMENYIKSYFETLTGLYPDIEFYACDVVNEAWLEDGGCRKPGANIPGGPNEGHSPWVQIYGDNSFIELAFTFARKYAPEGCKLYYNDYNEYMDKKRDAIIEMALDFKEKGIIDGIGMQSHLDVRKGPDAFPSISMYNTALDKYSELGLDIQVTELDATVPAGSGEEYFEAQAEYYKGIISSVYAHKDHVSALIFWGVTDDKSWRSGQQPLIFDRTYTAKPAFYSIVEVHGEE